MKDKILAILEPYKHETVSGSGQKGCYYRIEDVDRLADDLSDLVVDRLVDELSDLVDEAKLQAEPTLPVCPDCGNCDKWECCLKARVGVAEASQGFVDAAVAADRKRIGEWFRENLLYPREAQDAIEALLRGEGVPE